MAQRELNSICRAAGRLRVADTDELHGIPMLVKLASKRTTPSATSRRATSPPLARPEFARPRRGRGRERPRRQARAMGVSRTIGEAA